jgi:hypothetical protein
MKFRTRVIIKNTLRVDKSKSGYNIGSSVSSHSNGIIAADY